MLRLSEICNKKVGEWVLENLDYSTSRLQCVLNKLPKILSFKVNLVYAVLARLDSTRSKEQMSVRLIPFLKLCIKTCKVVCNIESHWGDIKCYKTSTVIRSLSDAIKGDLFNVISQDEEVKLEVLHYRNYISDISSVQQLLQRKSHHLQSLDLYGNLIMPECSFINLQELRLSSVNFPYEPTQLLTNMPSLSALVLYCVTGISDVLYKKLTCKITLPRLSKINIDQEDNDEEFQVAVRDFICDCDVTCLFHLTWLGRAVLRDPRDFTRGILSFSGVQSRHYDNIMNTLNNVDDHYSGVKCGISGNFHLLSELYVNVKLFNVVLPYLPTTTTHVREVRVLNIESDADVDDVREMLVNYGSCENLVFFNSRLTTTDISNMILNVNAANVIIPNYLNGNIEELKRRYPDIGWMDWAVYWTDPARALAHASTGVPRH